MGIIQRPADRTRDTGGLQSLLLQILKRFMAEDKAFVLGEELAGKNTKDTDLLNPDALCR